MTFLWVHLPGFSDGWSQTLNCGPPWFCVPSPVTSTQDIPDPGVFCRWRRTTGSGVPMDKKDPVTEDIRCFVGVKDGPLRKKQKQSILSQPKTTNSGLLVCRESVRE